MTDHTERHSGRTARMDDADPTTRFRPLDMPDPISGALWLTGLPDTDMRLGHYLVAAAENNVTQVVILVEDHEIRDLAPTYARFLSSDDLALSVRRLPIRDFGVPQSLSGFRHAAQGVASDLQNGERIVMHCRGGIGRTGLVAEAVLVELGAPPSEARGLVTAAGSRCETAEQVAFLRRAYANAEN